MSPQTQTWPKLDAADFATGAATYVDDVRPAGLLHVAVARSTRHRARVLDLDLSEARAMPGVARVLEGREAAEHLTAMPYAFGDPRLLGVTPRALPALTVDEVHYLGEPLALVAATDPRTARAAAAAIRVEYADLPARLGVPDLDDLPDADVLAQHHIRAGAPDDELAAAAHVLDLEVRLARSTTAPLEPRGYVADWDPVAERLTVHASHQQPFQLRQELAEVLGLAAASVRVVVPAVGGSFGLKMTGQGEAPLVALLSRLTERPVKWIESRGECFLGRAREQTHHVTAGFDVDGRVRVLRDRLVVPVGAPSSAPGWRQAYVSAAVLPTAYDVPNIDIEAWIVATNDPPWQSCRGFGKEPPVLVMERVMDLVARRLGLDPVEVRRRNLLGPGDLPHRMPSGYLIDSGDFPALLSAAVDAARSSPAARPGDPTDMLYGTGIAMEITPEGGGHAAGARPADDPDVPVAREAAVVSLAADGTVEVRTGVTSPGGGTESALARLAATELGTRRERVRIITGDTDRCPPGTGNASSRGVAIGGAAVTLAARELADRLRRHAAGPNTAPDEVLLGDDHVVVGDRRTSLAAAARSLAEHDGPEAVRVSVEHRAAHGTPAGEAAAFRTSYPYFSSGAYVARVAVDPTVGTVTVRALVAVHDCGVVVEPVLVDGQLHGAMAMGVGLALSEEISTPTPEDAPLSYKDYLVPRANDLPPMLVEHRATASPHTLTGAKGAGEAGVGGTMAAVANAVDDALAGLAAPVSSLPLTPARVLDLLARGSGPT